MCGIFAVLRNPSQRVPPSALAIGQLLDESVKAFEENADVVRAFTRSSESLREVDALLHGAPGVAAMVGDSVLTARVGEVAVFVAEHIARVEADLDAGRVSGDILEAVNGALTEAKDVVWALQRDRVRTAEAVGALVGNAVGSFNAIESYTSIQLALSAIDRLEVRGRDSAGIAVIVHGHGLSATEIDQLVGERHDPMFLSGSIERAEESVVFVYKAAAEIGALGDNVAAIRNEIQHDDILRVLLAKPGAEATIISHTRWASVGTVSEPNAHPIDSQEIGRAEQPYVLAVLNGDDDNYAELKARESLSVAEDITTDTKVIPTLMSRRLAAGDSALDAFCSTVDRFDGSVAIAASIARDPSKILLAVKGSGQGCNIGLAEDAFLVASEPYGLVEECGTYLRVDGEAVSPESGKSGQIVELSRNGAGTLGGIRRISYGGEELSVDPGELIETEVTTRDIDRGGAPHFLLKEISESPQSVRRTTRGKVIERRGRLEVVLSEDVLPQAIRDDLRNGVIKRIVAVGQGTAFVASRSLAMTLGDIASSASLAITCQPATELSGFGLRDDMSDTLVVAVSQSGTTTDTNRTVDMVRARGARVIAIVNRRQSDLTEKSDGVFYTSDGRDIEMSVASTKAFYAQVTASVLLAVAIADTLEVADRQQCQALLRALRKMPEAMESVLALRPEIAAAAQQFAPPRRSWAVVGNGANHIAAQELRIKLSELCYKSIAYDVTEDKKHIDLSAEPMILVCAAGLSGSNATDVAKEVAIYGAHKAAAIVIATEGAPFDSAAAAIFVPALHPSVDFILSAMVGHIFGYEAALAIDGQAKLLRSARAVLDDALALGDRDEEEVFEDVRVGLARPAKAIFDEMRSGAFNGHLEPSSAVRMSSLLLYASGVLPLDSLEVENGHPTTPIQMMSDLLGALTVGIDELTRPIDAVKHQAKTVTVGISRTEDSYADAFLVKEVIAAGAVRDRISYRSLRMLAALEPAVESVLGFTRYQVDGQVGDRNATLRVVDRGGVASGIRSRTEDDPRLTGTKHRAAYERMVTVGRGQRDGRSVIIVPEVKDQQVTGIVLLHVSMKSTLDAESARGVLTGYRNRYSAIVDAVTETESEFDDNKLGQVPLIDLLVEPVWVLASHWRSS